MRPVRAVAVFYRYRRSAPAPRSRLVRPAIADPCRSRPIGPRAADKTPPRSRGAARSPKRRPAQPATAHARRQPPATAQLLRHATAATAFRQHPLTPLPPFDHSARCPGPSPPSLSFLEGLEGEPSQPLNVVEIHVYQWLSHGFSRRGFLPPPSRAAPRHGPPSCTAATRQPPIVSVFTSRSPPIPWRSRLYRNISIKNNDKTPLFFSYNLPTCAQVAAFTFG